MVYLDAPLMDCEPGQVNLPLNMPECLCVKKDPFMPVTDCSVGNVT